MKMCQLYEFKIQQTTRGMLNFFLFQCLFTSFSEKVNIFKLIKAHLFCGNKNKKTVFDYIFNLKKKLAENLP